MAALFSRPGIKVNIEDTNGEHDLYLVFTNDKAKPAEPLVSLSDIKLSDVRATDKSSHNVPPDLIKNITTSHNNITTKILI